ncbi:MAG: hypothetical protein DLM70_06780, partial [Chloroflexi bacterium]
QSAGRYASALGAFQNAEVGFLRGKGLRFDTAWNFHNVLNGFAATLTPDQIPRLLNAPNVEAVLPDPQVHVQLDKSTRLVDAPAAWTLLGGSAQAGRGIFIADIDSGIDVTQPCFRDASFKVPVYGRRADTTENVRLTNNKVVVARAYGDDPRRHYSAADVTGHGTFTASIEACDDNTPTPLGTRTNGVAPGAYLMNYNVFPDGSRGPYEDQVIAALDAALIDGADVANLSLGNPQGTGDPRLDAENLAVESAVKAGLTIVTAAGNAGPTSQSISSPASAIDAIAVGSVSNSRGVYSSVSVAGSGITTSLSRIRAKQGSYAWTRVVGPTKAVSVGLGRKRGDDPHFPNANDFAGKSVRGAIAVIERGNGSSPTPLAVRTKLANAAGAGAVGVIMVDNVDEAILPTLDQGPVSLPLSLIGKSDGDRLVSRIRQHHNVLLAMDSTPTAFADTPDILSDFSARGFGPNFEIKPDLVAPGDDIYASTETSVRSGDMYDPRGFTSQSGTSFSAPHVTGAAALVLQTHPTWTPAMVKASLVDTASAAVTTTRGLPFVMQVGSGLLDVAAAVSTPAYFSPTSLSWGEVNTAYGSVVHVLHVSLVDAGTGAGPWELSIRPLHGSAFLVPSVPARIDESVGGRVDVPVQVRVGQGVPTGDYDGYIEGVQGAKRLRVPYFVHVVKQRVRAGDVFLVDDTTSRFRPASGGTSTPRADSFYRSALTQLGRRYTYWNEGTLGPPSLVDLKRASAAIYFTGRNLNGYSPLNTDPDGLLPPLGAQDLTTIHAYLDAGGKVFITGVGTALSDPDWLAVELGAHRSRSSVWTNGARRNAGESEVMPSRPSAVPRPPFGAPRQSGIFANLKPIDLSNGGDGARDNGSIFSIVAGTIGVSALTSVRGVVGGKLRAFGYPALRALGANTSPDIAVVSSDEPSFQRPRRYFGRSVLFAFGFEGINSNTGYATRAQVMQRVLSWLNDVPEVFVPSLRARVRVPVFLHARLSAPAGVHPVQYTWQIEKQRVISLHPVQHSFPRPGRFKVRVSIVDSLGHRAVSGWSAVVVR